MATEQASQPGFTWLAFALMTVVSWGLYGILLHTGQMAMGDPVNGRYKAFLFVGLAYVLTAVLAPLVILVANGANWQMPGRGIAWSLVAGAAGAIALHPPAGGLAAVRWPFLLGILMAAAGGCLVTLYRPQ